MPAAIWETAQGGPGVLLAGEVGFNEDTVPLFFRRTIRRGHGPRAYEVQFSSLRKEGSAKTQYLRSLEGRFGEDTHSAFRYLGAKAQYPFFRRHGRSFCEVHFSSLGKEGAGEGTIPPFFQKDDSAKAPDLFVT